MSNHTHLCTGCKKTKKCNCAFLKRVNWGCESCTTRSDRAISVFLAHLREVLEFRVTKRGRKGGFTLIELMVVVAIIGILAAIAIPQFANTLRRSQEATTKGNLGTLRSTLAIYFADTEGSYPTDNLASLAINHKYIQGIPMKYTPPYHDPGSVVEVITPATQAASTGDWGYFGVAYTPEWGQVVVNCVHRDVKGVVWTSY